MKINLLLYFIIILFCLFFYNYDNYKEDLTVNSFTELEMPENFLNGGKSLVVLITGVIKLLN